MIYAAVRLRGSVNVRKGIRDTLGMLRLTRANHCVLVPKDSSHEGMLRKAQDSITWGEVSQETLEKLISKRGGIPDAKKAKDAAKQIIKDGTARNIKGMEPVFRLSPPTKGFRSTRLQFPRGDLGYRGDKINGLLERMI